MLEKDALFNRISRYIKRADIIAVRAALDSGLNPNLTNHLGWTLLMVTAIHGNVPIGQLLLERGADPNMRTTRFSAVSFAYHDNHRRFLNLLLDNGAIWTSSLTPAARWERIEYRWEQIKYRWLLFLSKHLG